MKLTTKKALVLLVAEHLIKSFLIANNKQLDGREGIYFAIQGRRTIEGQDCGLFDSLEFALLGNLDKDKMEEKKKFAAEKINRLVAHQNLKNPEQSHFSSFQSENTSSAQYGGGIRTKNFYMSASGFPPHLDQKFLLELAVMVDELSFQEAVEIDFKTWTYQEKWMKLI